jgi:osmotically-inducible protein OsmY
MKKFLLLSSCISFAFMLNGCIPVALVAGVAAGATAGGAILYDQRPMNTMMGDQKAESTAQYFVNRDRQLASHSHLQVAVYNRIALIVGQAETPELSQRAYQVVSSVRNIDRIYNEIKIDGEAPTLKEKSNDAWLTTKVKAAMVEQKGLHASQIRVVVANSTAYLMGLVTPQEGETAADAARHVAGIVKVVKVFQYLS